MWNFVDTVADTPPLSRQNLPFFVISYFCDMFEVSWSNRYNILKKDWHDKKFSDKKIILGDNGFHGSPLPPIQATCEISVL